MRDMERLLTIQEVAQILNRSVKTVRRRVASGDIPVIQEGGPGTGLRFDPADIHRVIHGAKRQRRLSIEEDRRGNTARRRSGRIPNWKRQSDHTLREKH